MMKPAIELVFDIDPITNRKCRECSSFLPTSRYFACYICKPDMPVDEEDFVYYGEYTEDTNISDMEEIEVMK